MNIPEEAIQAAARAIHDMDCDGGPGCPAAAPLSTEGRYGRWARAALGAAAPLIAAQVLRSHAQDLEDGCEEEIRGMDGGFVDGYRVATAHAVRALRGDHSARIAE